MAAPESGRERVVERTAKAGRRMAVCGRLHRGAGVFRDAGGYVLAERGGGGQQCRVFARFLWRRGAALAGVGALLALAGGGCGARTSLLDERSAPIDGEGGNGGAGGGTTSGSTSTPGGCTSDAQCDDDVDCTLDVCASGVCESAPQNTACDDGVVCTVDVCTASGCEHTSNDALCEDGLLCTVDVCEGLSGCDHQLKNTPCDDGIECTTDICDTDTDTCINSSCDSLCDDGVFCNGVERCDTTFGCTSGPLACTLGLGCESSMCSEGEDSCNHMVPPGCAAPDVHLLATDAAGALWDITPYGNTTATFLADGGLTYLDVAILGDRWFAVSTISLVELTPGTNEVIQELGFLPVNSLAGGPDGMLYGAQEVVIRVDPDTGEQVEMGTLPFGHVSSGDIAFLGERMFVSTESGCGGTLVEFNLESGVGTVLGGDGLGCVYGLATGDDGDLFILNCDGKVGLFDPDSGEARIFATTGVTVYGADRLP